MSSFKKHITLFFIVVLLLPTAIQTMHAYECHEHETHELTDNQQIDEEDALCCKLHIPFETLSSDVASKDMSSTQKTVFKEVTVSQSQVYKIVYIHKKSSRAPPVIMA